MGGFFTETDDETITTIGSIIRYRVSSGEWEITNDYTHDSFFSAKGTPDTYVTLKTTDFISVGAETLYNFRTWAFGTGVLIAEIEWYTSGDSLISTSTVIDSQTLTNEWELYSNQIVSPATAAKAKVQFITTGSESVYIDDVVLQIISWNYSFSIDPDGTFRFDGGKTQFLPEDGRATWNVPTSGSVPTIGIEEHDIYLDDGSNTTSGSPGFRRYTGSIWEDIAGSSGGGGGSGEVLSIVVVQAAHGFSTGDAIYFDGSDWQKAKADAVSTLGTHIANVTDSGNFGAVQAGKITVTGHGLGSVGEWLFVSDATAGLLSTTESDLSNPLAQITDADTLFVHNFRASTLTQENVSIVYTDQSGGTSDTYGVLAGTIDGANTTFTVSQSKYISGSLTVYLNGQLQTQGSSEDWTETTPGSGTFDFATAPIVGDEITVIYTVSKLTPSAGAAYTVTNASTDRTYDADATSINELADVLGTLIADLQNRGTIGS